MAREPFEILHLKKQYRANPKAIEDFDFIGYDTETIDGLARLIANSRGQHIHPESFLDCIQFLCRDSTRSAVGFFFNMKYDFQAVLKWLPPDDWAVLFGTGELAFLDYEIFYIPKKFLKIRYRAKNKKPRTWAFFDISQYFRMSLENAASKYLGEHKKDTSQRDMSALTMDDMLDPAFVEYCEHDALLAAKLAGWWVDLCRRMGLYTKNYASPAAIAARYFQTEVKFPTLNRFIRRPAYHVYIKFAWNATTGAFINVFKRGYFEKVYVYDINSCYPYQMTKLPDISKGVFCYRKGEPDLDAFKMGWLRARVNIEGESDGWYLPPIPMYRRLMSNYFPAGEFETPLTLIEYEQLKDVFDIEIVDGVYWQPTGEISYFLKDTILRIYQQRIETDDEQAKYFLKIVLNGIYGKFFEKHPILKDPKKEGLVGKLKTGNLFNPFYASYILAGARLQIFDAAVKCHQDDLIAVFTDSVMSKSPLDLPLSKTLGEWGLDHTGDAVVVGCGVYAMRTEDGKLNNKMRGFHIDPALSKSNLFDLIKEQRNKTEIDVSTLLNISPKTALITKDPARMNRLVEMPRTLNLNIDTKRIWLNDFKYVKELLETEIDSLPFPNHIF